MNKVYIMRGASGSGKDWWIKKHSTSNKLPLFNQEHANDICLLRGKGIVFSTDLYFHTDNGYVFEPAKLSEYHNRCLCAYDDFITQLKPDYGMTIFVNNTNIRSYEISPYYRLAEARGLDVEIVWVIAPPEVCVQRNVHKVPPHVIAKQFLQVEPLPDWWKVRLVLNP